MEWIYLILLLVGLFYAIVVAVAGGIFGDAGGGHAGGFGAHGAHGIGGHGDVGDADHGAAHFSPFSPAILATFIASFGATGLVCLKVFGFSLLVHLGLSLASGFAISAVALNLFRKLFAATQSSSHPSTSELENLEAEVLVPIPQNGLGKIAYAARGSRFTGSARSLTGEAIPASSTVVIKKIVGEVFHVKPVP